MNERQLLDLKKKIDQTKSEISSLKGKQELLMQQLEQQFGCTTLKQAEKKAESLQVDIDNLDLQIKKGVQELESKYDVPQY